MKFFRLYWKIPWSSIAFLICLTKNLSGSSNYNQNKCTFPSRWEGTWFQSGVRSPITIQDNKLSNKGRCLASEGDKFLVVDENDVCFRCVVVHEKHANVLQYKETFCHGRTTLQNLCTLITGDALLYSMFREEAVPVPCPFKPPHSFTYNRGHGECRSPISSIDSCTQDSRILFKYQACPDIYGSESAVEELQCLATWKEGSSRYLVGKVHHSHATSNEDRYRCFVYEKTSSTNMVANMEQYGANIFNGIGMPMGRRADEDVEFQIAQSGDATCNGLFTPLEGSRIMTLRKGNSPSKCKFPNWLTVSGHWHTLDYKRSYSFHHRNTTLHISNSTSTSGKKSDGRTEPSKPFADPSWASLSDHNSRIICTELKQVTAEIAHLVAHATTGCQSGFVCLTFYKRDDHVIEVQTGTTSHRQEDACNGSHFDTSTSPYITLVTTVPEQKLCPYAGNYIVSRPEVKQRSSHSAGDQSRPDVSGATFVEQRNLMERDLMQNQIAEVIVRNEEHKNIRFKRSSMKSYVRRKVLRKLMDSGDVTPRILRSSRDNDTHIYVNGTSSGSHTTSDTKSNFKASDIRENLSGETDYNLESNFSVKKFISSIRGSSILGREDFQRGSSDGKRERKARDVDVASARDLNCALDYKTLTIGCAGAFDTMQFRTDCKSSSESVSVYSCHGGWVSENGSEHYLITTPLSRSSRGPRRYCFTYRLTEDGTTLRFTSSADTCRRGNLALPAHAIHGASFPDDDINLNITLIGKCLDANRAHSTSSFSIFCLAIILWHSTVKCLLSCR
nr:PREDICTED: uncharacterized protein LOC109035778 isoform X1 [Bemisia tabaci]XP_018905074.1 PREDICTED: uncharacterized protein LOC109035778 isoform X1 [Bemisia tabaci]